MRATEPCGCKHDGVHWLHLCAEHTAEDREHRAAAAEQRSVRARRDWLTTPNNLGNAEGLV
jgi:hypothetical protein